jgi:hypothetical protein
MTILNLLYREENITSEQFRPTAYATGIFCDLAELSSPALGTLEEGKEKPRSPLGLGRYICFCWLL